MIQSFPSQTSSLISELRRLDWPDLLFLAAVKRLRIRCSTRLILATCCLERIASSSQEMMIDC